jgi:hypothetical protein
MASVLAVERFDFLPFSEGAMAGPKIWLVIADIIEALKNLSLPRNCSAIQSSLVSSSSGLYKSSSLSNTSRFFCRSEKSFNVRMT